jgi:hypothetical protein
MEGRSRRGLKGVLIDAPGAAAFRSDGHTCTANLIGVRIKMSLLGAARNPHFAEKEGTVVGSGRLNCSIRVLFDGRKTPITLHRDYVELSAACLD